MALADSMGGGKKPDTAVKEVTPLPKWSFKKALNDHLTDKKDFRSPGIHVSGLWNVCPKQKLLSRMFPKEVPAEVIPPGLRLTFDVGHAWHWLMQDKYLKRMGMKHKCEIGLAWPEHNLVGRCDAVMFLDVDWMLEFKSMNSFQFENLRDPLAPHILQLSTYMWLYNEIGPGPATGSEIVGGKVIYFDKNKQIGQKGEINIKEFDIPYDESVGSRITARMEWLKAVEEGWADDGEAMREEVDPEFRICTSIMDDRAKKCAWAHECFFSKKKKRPVAKEQQK